MTGKSDRELLELAALAGGIKGIYDRIHQTYGDQWVDGIYTGSPLLWNPLVDDGDALRLSVACKFTLDISFSGCAVRHISGIKSLVSPEVESNLYAATRLAIVSAAAAIGEKMP